MSKFNRDGPLESQHNRCVTIALYNLSYPELQTFLLFED